jgi:hypothetical protein
MQQSKHTPRTGLYDRHGGHGRRGADAAAGDGRHRRGVAGEPAPALRLGSGGALGLVRRREARRLHRRRLGARRGL